SIRAAKWLLAARIRHRTSRLPYRNEPSIRHAAQLFKTRKTQVSRHLKSLKDTGLLATSSNAIRRPRSLRNDEDSAFEGYTYWLIESSSLAAKDLLEDATNRL
ncbi:hypothetical protein L209DRAFT_689773, partial [Thermothelomyces heterothallicus CBS 203.75]